MKKSMVFLVVAMNVLFIFTACSSKKGENSSEKIKIGLSMESLESQFLVKNKDVMEQTAKDLGVEIITVIAEGDPTRQNQQVENLIALGCKSIIIFPKDGASIAAVVKKAQNAGVNVIMDNRSIQSDVVVPELQVLADNRKMAYEVLKQFGEKARRNGEKYKTILLIGSLADGGAVERKNGHMEAIKEFSDVFELVSEIPTDWNHDTTLKGLQNAFQSNPDASLVITPSDYLLPPIRSAMEQAGRWAKIGEPNHTSLITFDGDEIGMQYLKDGYSEADAAQDPIFEGITCVEWAVKLAEGKTPPTPIIYDEGIIVTVDNFDEVGPTVWSWDMLK